MATEEQIAQLRLKIDEPTVDPYSDVILSDIIAQAEDNLDLAAADIWEQKASSFSTLVDTSESGSSRSMSQLSKNAIAQAKYYSDKVRDAEVEEEADLVPAPRTRTAVRK